MRAVALLMFAIACVEEAAPKSAVVIDTGDDSLPTADADRDGYPEGVDCDEGDAAVNPGANERCNGKDDDCDGIVDESGSDATLWFFDDDGDGFGDPGDEVQSCAAPAGTVENADDCDDLRGDIFPGAVEVCNGDDDNCDGDIDEDAVDMAEFFDDRDGDGFGDPATGHMACAPDEDDVAVADDCDDSTNQANPSVPEICRDGRDNDCDGGPNTCGWRGDVLTSGAWGTLSGWSETDGFGQSVVGADLAGAGAPGLFVAARDHDGASSSIGAIYGFEAVSRGATSATAAVSRYWGEGVGSLAGADGGLWAGDVDADGYDDLLVRGRSSGGVSRAYLMRGPHAGDAYLITAELVISDVLGSGGVFASGGIGDTTGDGVAELILVRPALGDALVFDGGLAGSKSASDAMASLSLSGGSVAHSLAAGHDLDGDGIDDLLLQGSAAGGDAQVLLFAGPVSGDRLAADADGRWSGDGLGFDSLGVDDLDNDGYEDILASSFAGPGGEVQVFVGPFFGGGGGAPQVRVSGEGPDGEVGAFASVLGDGDGDGRNELLVPVAGPSPFVLLLHCPSTGTYGLGDGDARFLGGPERAFAIGDLNDDGLEDIALGAASGAGGVWLYWGGAI